MVRADTGLVEKDIIEKNLILRPVEPIDDLSIKPLEKELDAALVHGFEKGCTHVVVDLTDVRHIPSAFTEPLRSLIDRTIREGGQVSIAVTPNSAPAATIDLIYRYQITRERMFGEKLRLRICGSVQESIEKASRRS